MNGSYQHFGPQGMIARVERPAALLLSIKEANSSAINRPISAESRTMRNRTFNCGLEGRSRAGIAHQR